ncbi:MAG: SpoIIE family protein phosphatase [Xanthomonadales bacterium]|nr:SpoIIE family protein phosphatase [Gammaproteobacteria bacterium]NND58288.1 SpoIIE family protein phosphatase [Xanthomonadales bacterium]NNK52001.1 SpoIIE family protein phosphatase [Xanthomonadales bacterium]
MTNSQAISPPRLSQDALARILDVTQKLARPFELLQMLTEVVEAGESVLSADKASLWLYDAANDDLTMRVPVFRPAPRLAAGEGLVGECLSTREIINVSDAYSDPRFSRTVDKAIGYKTQSVLNIPLLGEEKQPVGVLQLLNKIGGVFDASDELLASTLAAQCAVAVQRTQLTEALLLKERLDEEVALAREIQMSTLPTVMPLVKGYDVHGHFVPTGHAGGDLFDLVVLNRELFVLMGDATGHGFGPALSATQMQAMLRVAFRCGASLNEAFRHVNNQLVEDLPDDRFITAFMGFLDPVTSEVRFHSGGQGPILHFRAADESCEWHRPTTFPVGIMELEDTGDSQILKMEPGDVLVLLSDGIYEYESRQGVQFGEDRVASLMKYHHRLPMVELSKQILTATYEHGDGVAQQDDITLVLLKRLPEES